MNKITVLMPVYNGGKYLRESIESILNQTYTNFEFLIIDDGSTDNSRDVIQSYNDSRIIFVKNEKNLGLVESLNKGLKLAQGEYIARMDQDDISLPTRLEEQINFMNNHPEIGICGTYHEFFDGREGLIIYQQEHNWILAYLMLQGCAMAHSTVFFRRKLFKENDLFYDKNFPHSEDYELWTRAIMRIKFANLKKVLVKYRAHSEQTCKQYNEAQIQMDRLIRINMFKRFGFELSEQEFDTLYTILNRKEIDYDRLSNIQDLFNKIINTSKEKNIYSDYFIKLISIKWYKFCRNNAKINPDIKLIKIFYKYPYLGEIPFVKKLNFLREISMRLMLNIIRLKF